MQNFIGSLILAFVVRTNLKVCLDFTSFIPARHPYELGGAYFCFTMIVTPFTCLYFGSWYLNYVENEEVAEGLSYVFTEQQVYWGISALIVVQITSFSVFLLLMEDKYRSTFYSFKTGSQHVVGSFENASTETVKIGVINNHRSL
ncbi:hypothetical protein TrLO_g4266 [Triparma laevis f. longispina]|uniref:Uncharacterized protein n=1 Tax=Triparma laevis f. longispina TaxID=1714387 RepID=A0A9W7DLX1_9STRA|nr:hypothetical protein TrLO_g4266 [Triparma laevis f. longispina]